MSWSGEQSDENFDHSDSSDIELDDSYDIEEKLSNAEESLETLRFYSWSRGMNVFMSDNCLKQLIDIM